MDSSKPTVVWVLGGPGSGKGTQCEKLIAKYPQVFHHISTGQMLRQGVAKDLTQQNLLILKLMEQGKMVPSRIVVKFIQNKFQEVGNKKIFIIDGYPRNDQNIEIWDQVVKSHSDLKFLNYFECPDEQLRRRLLQRAKISGRPDDNPETIQKRIKNFNIQTKPMLDNFKKNGGPLQNVNAHQSIQKVFQDFENVLKKYKII